MNPTFGKTPNHCYVNVRETEGPTSRLERKDVGRKRKFALDCSFNAPSDQKTGVVFCKCALKAREQFWRKPLQESMPCRHVSERFSAWWPSISRPRRWPASSTSVRIRLRRIRKRRAGVLALRQVAKPRACSPLTKPGPSHLIRSPMKTPSPVPPSPAKEDPRQGE